jgi:DNA-binding transcriptional LysR family regulator
MPFPRYTVRQLEAFCQVAETLSFTAAGDRLSLTPSAVSQLVHELEASTGFRLFERSTRRVALSAAGKEFLPLAETVLRQLRAAERAAADVRNRSAGLVRVAAPMVLASTVLPAAIRAYVEERPDVIARIRDTTVEGLVAAVSGGEADLAVGPDRASGEDVTRTPIFESPWVLWCAPEHPLAGRRQLQWRDLRGHALVAAGRDHERNVAQMHVGLADDERVTPVDVVENISTALGIAAAGLAATLSPAYVGIWARRFGLVSRRLRDPGVARGVCLYRPSHRTISPAAEGFAAHLVQWIAEWGRTAR